MFFFFNTQEAIANSAIGKTHSLSITIPTGATSANYTLPSAFNTSKSVIFWGGNTCTQSTAVANTYRARLTLVDSTTIRANRNTSSASETVTAYACIAEFSTSFIKSVQYGTVTLGSISIVPPDDDGVNFGTYARAAISAVDLSNSFVLMLGDSSQNPLNITSRELYALELKDSIVTGGKAVFAQRGSTTASGNKTVSFCVVELQAGIIKSKQNIVTTLSSANTQDTAAITSVDAANSILINNGAYTSSSNNWNEHLYNKCLTDGSTITYRRNGTLTNSRTLLDAVVEFENGVMSGNQPTLDSFTASSHVYNITPVDTAKSIILQNGFNSAGTTSPTALMCAVALSASDSVTSYNQEGLTAVETAATVVGLL